MNNKLIKIDSPSQLAEFSKTLKEFIVKQNLYTQIQGKNYVNVEGWQFAGISTGIIPIIKSVEKIDSQGEIKYRAEVELRKGDQTMGYGVAICSNKEGHRKTADEYVIASMAQTRAIGKAYRNLFSYLMKMASFEPTPAEEIEVEPKEATKHTISEVVEGYNKMISESKTEAKKRITLRRIKQGLDNGVINKKTFDELKLKNGLDEEV